MATTVLSGFALLPLVSYTSDGAIPPKLLLQPIVNEFFDAPPIPLVATSNSQGAITFVLTGGPATLAGNVLTLTGVGLVSVAVFQAPSGGFLGATVTGSFNVFPADPSLAFLPLYDVYYGVAPFPLAITTLSPGVTAFFLVSGPATLSGSVLTITGAGVVTVGVGQKATVDYAAAQQEISFTVLPIQPVLRFAPILASQLFLGSQFLAVASSASSGAITYSVLMGPASLAANLVTLTAGGGVVSLQAQQAATADYGQATTTVSFDWGGEGFGELFGTFGSGL